MTTGSIGPGTVLADRYRLDDLLTESAGARFWRATDTVLARSVAIHAVPSDDSRAPHLLEAARVSATVTDPHLLRVLDCDDRDGITWVVHEWGDGISLDLMLQRGTLPAARAAWLTREVAEAIAAGHAQGIAHGRLNPEAVLVTHAGAVKLIGYVVDAALEVSRPHDPLYGELDDREADVINLAGILYAALTGRWPGVARSAVPKAPRESRRPLRPRQVRAGVPRTLDAICERVLHKEASQHTMPIETAHEIAAALADYVGDPALTAPLTAAGMHAEPELEPLLEPDPDATQLAFGPALDPEADPAGRRARVRPTVRPGGDATGRRSGDRPGSNPAGRRRRPARRRGDRSDRNDGVDGASTATTRSSTASPSTAPRPWHRCPRPPTRTHRPRRSRTSPSDRCSPPPSDGCRPAPAPVSRRGSSSPWSTPRNPRRRGLPAGLRRERWGRRDAGHRSRTRVLALRGQPGGGQRGPHRQGGPRLAADGDRDRRTPRAGGGRGDRVQPRSPGRRAPDGLGAVPGTLELRAGPGRTHRAGRRERLRSPRPSRRRRTPTRRPTRSTATPPPPGPRAPTAATPRSVASSPASG